AILRRRASSSYAASKMMAMPITIGFIRVLAEGRRPAEAPLQHYEAPERLAIPSVSGASQLAARASLRGLEAGAHSEGENRERAEGQSDLANHVVSPLQRVRDYLGL